MSQVISLNVAALAAVAVAMAKQDVRYYLNGVCVDRDEAGRVTLVATNGHALVAASDPGMTWAGDSEREGKAAQLILPRDFVAIVLKAAAKQGAAVELTATEAQGQDARVFDLTATVGAMTARARSIDGRFPDWRQAMRGTENPKPAGEGFHAERPCMAAFDPAVLEVATGSALAYAKASGFRKPGAVSVQFVAAGEASTGFALHGGGASVAGVVMPLRGTGDDAPTRAAIRAMLAEPAADLAAAA